MPRVFTITEGLENLGALKTGGQGSVYKGRRIGEITTAIKILPTPIYSESAKDKNYIAFQNEVQKLKKVNEEPDPNVVKILSSGITDSGNFPFIEMEFIEGPDLEELLKPPHQPIFTIKEVLKVADQLSAALAHCHKIGIRHGDIKSNNVKYNVSTGNYVLLDFGLSVMSNEQRRTSLRNAGAIEFMAPEQSEGQMLFESDVYSFGIILYELLAGQVPFGLNDKGETARNKVMLAHLETLPPDILALRQKCLPAGWSEQKKKEEMQVPDWLTNLVYKCLEKRAQDRFKNGMELHEYVGEHLVQNVDISRLSNKSLSLLEQENKRLRREKEQLQQQVLQYQQQLKEGAITNSSKNANNDFGTENIDNKSTASRPRKKKNGLITSIVLIALIATAAIFIYNKYSNIIAFRAGRSIGQYKIIASHTYLYNDANEYTRTNVYVTPKNATAKAYSEKDGFLYAEVIDQKGQRMQGWLRKQDVMTLENWRKRNKTINTAEPQDPGITAQLQNARQLLSDGKTVEALIIYNTLSRQQVPEAMYQYGKLALQNVNLNITCTEAFNLLKKAEAKGYVPAKRTLGLLYSFGDNKKVLQQNNFYVRCSFGKNIRNGSKLLMEATLAGDTAANRFLEAITTK